jgi:hypothetical protein
MKLYHGSTQNVKKPIVERGRPSTDFGKGFYTTTNIEQARDWALIRKRNAGGGAKAIISIYEADDDLLEKVFYDTLRFNMPDDKWLAFVVDCRKGVPHDHDIVFGAVANDKIYVTIEQYENGLLDSEQTLARLKINEFYNQISFHSPAAVRELRFVESVEAGSDE